MVRNKVTKDTLEKVKTAGFIVLMGIILSVLGVMSVLFMPFYWIWTKLQDYMDSKESDVPNYLSGKSSKDRD